MSTRMLVAVICLLILANVGLSVALIHERINQPEHPCGCDTCVESYWEAIRKAHSELNMAPVGE
jgi:hypothetical protein